jgi:hypothetical protein
MLASSNRAINLEKERIEVSPEAVEIPLQLSWDDKYLPSFEIVAKHTVFEEQE